MKEISLIIGSGFSVPDGMKTVGQINETLANLDEKDIYIHSDMTLILLNGQEKPDFSIHREDELFFIHFIKWYIENVEGDFNYERFYDYVTSYQRFQNHKEELEPFFQDFKRDVLKSTSSLMIYIISCPSLVTTLVNLFQVFFNQESIMKMLGLETTHRMTVFHTSLKI